MLANCHRLGMDRYDTKGNRQPGPHPQQWTINEFLPTEFHLAGSSGNSSTRDKSDRIEGSINVLKVFLPPGAKPTTLSRDSFTVTPEEELEVSGVRRE